MEWSWTPFSVPSLVSALVCTALAVEVWRRRPAPGASALAWLALASAFWAFLQTLGVSATGLATKLLLAKIQYVGILSVPVLWLAFALDYTGRGTWRRRVESLTIPILPIATLALVLTNDRHRLVWRAARLVEDAPFAALELEHGPWFAVSAIFNYGMVAMATGLLAWSLARAPRARPQLAAAIVAPLFVVAPNLLYVSGFNPVPYLDLTPLGLGAGALVMALALMRFRLLDLTPFAREAVVESMRDAVVALDREGRIADLNAAAAQLLGDRPERLVGRAATAALPAPLARALGAAETPALGAAPIELELGERHYEATLAHLEEPGRGGLGRVLVLRDVDDRRRAELDLRRTEQELREANERLERLAYTDSLTGLGSRGFFLDRLEAECTRARRYGLSLALVLIDLDHFKEVNDAHGHQAGDRVLMQFARLLESCRRGSDLAGRVGGEEFGLLLAETGSAGALAGAERLRDLIAATPLRVTDEIEISISLSAGVATFRPGESADAFLRRADDALYVAKEGGRNRVEVAPADET